ncbi:acyltransferase family protein [Sinomonas sp. P10A9]|uniref:Acyltransferase family protein n=1 Tax=Sinomonas puerhi TaxID=3238584 RepID=A0AB39L835_9MICC
MSVSGRYFRSPNTSSGTKPSASVKELRKDIQGLRAIAVGLVVLNHLWPGRVTGGYVGVDVFFVISGYLITNHLLSELNRRGSINFGRFYARRARRLLPAALLVSLVSLGLAFAFLPFDRWSSIGSETIGAAFYFENWLLAVKSVNYSAHNQMASTVQHYWSLSVEEQFYIVWPFLLLGLFWLSTRFRLKAGRVLLAGMILIGLGSLIFCIAYTAVDPSPAYFVTQGRVWEFATGAVIGIVSVAVSSHAVFEDRSKLLRGVLQAVGLLLILLPAATYNDHTPFPGTFALVPVIGTAVIIAVGPGRPTWSPLRIFEIRPIQYLGDVSYSLYLWHWPLIILAPAVMGRELSNTTRVAVALAAFLLAALSKHFIEDPCRKVVFANWPVRRVLWGTLVGAAAVGLMSLSVIAGASTAQKAEADRAAAIASETCFGAGSLIHPSECRVPFGSPRVVNVGDNEAPWFDSPECKGDPDPLMAADQKVLTRCDFTGGRAPTGRAWLVGDSHAEQWKVAVHELARKEGWLLSESLVGGCPIVDAKRVGFMGMPSNSPIVQSKCLGWSSALTERISAEKPNVIFVSGFGAGEQIDDGTGRLQLDQYASAVQRRFSQWVNGGAKVVVLRDTPLTLDRSTPECISLNSSEPLKCANLKADALVEDPIAAGAKSMDQGRVQVIDLSNYFCPDDNCYAVIGGVHVFFDKDHVTRTYVKTLIPELISRYESLPLS